MQGGPSNFLDVCISGAARKEASPTRGGPLKLGACNPHLAKTSGQMVVYPSRTPIINLKQPEMLFLDAFRKQDNPRDGLTSVRA